MKRLIVMDMDGTLLNEQKQIPPLTKQALLKLEKEGTALVLASGRGKERLMNYVEELQMDHHQGYLITSNGCGIYNIEKDYFEVVKLMTHEEADYMLKYLRNKYPENDLVIMAKDHAFLNTSVSGIQQGTYNRNTIDSLKNRPNKEFMSVYEIEEEMYKVCIFDEPSKVEAILTDLHTTFKDTYWCGRVAPFWIEITPIDISKGNALLKIMQNENIVKDDVYVFGDGENDISMLKVGHGIAMGNALENVKALCEYVTLSNEEEGIAVFIDKYL